jgi:serine phosphatase RsbU (regulator of sigma subunit)
MLMETPAHQGSSSHRLAAQIESLQEGLRKLSRAATLRELTDQFTTVLSRVFPDTDIDVFHRADLSDDWQPIRQTRPESVKHLLSISHDQSALLASVDAASTTLCVVQRLVDKSHVAMVLAQQVPGATYSDVDVVSLKLFLQLFDNAYQSLLHRRNEKDLVFALNHRVLQLNSLIDTGIEVSKLDQGTSLQQLALERAASLTNASKGAFRVKRQKQVKEEAFFPSGIRPKKTGGHNNHIKSSFKFDDCTYTFELFEKESRKGVIPFEETDQLLLDALARQVHASLENRYLHQQALEKQKIERDMSVAASIQQRILPESLPAIEGYDIAGINIPSKFVGGDYFDCIPLPQGRYALVIADVAGKGIPAALLVSSLHAYLSAYLETTMSLVELAGRLNKVICHTSTDDKFITAFIALLTPGTGEIEAVNAGHNPVYWLRNDGTIQELKAGGVPFGMLDLDLPYQNEQIVLGKGERLLLYTDGIPEATNEQNQLYESSVPLQEFLKHRKPDRAEGFIKDLIDDIKKFTGNAPQSDDITALYLVRL